MKNVLNSGDIKSLKEGQVLLTQLREVSNGFMSIELAEVKKGSKGLSAVFLFNLQILKSCQELVLMIRNLGL